MVVLNKLDSNTNKEIFTLEQDKKEVNFGADLGFDKIHETQGACPGAVCLVKSRKTIIANDDTFALAA